MWTKRQTIDRRLKILQRWGCNYAPLRYVDSHSKHLFLETFLVVTDGASEEELCSIVSLELRQTPITMGYLVGEDWPHDHVVNVWDREWDYICVCVCVLEKYKYLYALPVKPTSMTGRALHNRVGEDRLDVLQANRARQCAGGRYGACLCGSVIPTKRP